MTTIFAKEKKVAITSTEAVDSDTQSSSAVPELGLPHKPKQFWFQKTKNYDPTAIATPAKRLRRPRHGREIQAARDWENVHRFDPLFRWNWEEENKLVRKIDFRIMVWACIMFMALELDRANLSQALTDNFLTDLNMTTNGSLAFPPFLVPSVANQQTTTSATACFGCLSSVPSCRPSWCPSGWAPTAGFPCKSPSGVLSPSASFG